MPLFVSTFTSVLYISQKTQRCPKQDRFFKTDKLAMFHKTALYFLLELPALI